jgi:hypothetical protein
MSFRRVAEELTDLAVDVRYPGMFADRKQAREALKKSETIRAAVRQSLGLT